MAIPPQRSNHFRVLLAGANGCSVLSQIPNASHKIAMPRNKVDLPQPLLPVNKT